MNMENFPYEVWSLHRKLFHRFLKYQKYFTRSTKSLPEYKSAEEVKEEKVQPVPAASSAVETTHVICLLSSSEEEVSEDDSDDDDKESSTTEV